MILLHPPKKYNLTKFKNEAELEEAVVQNASDIFGEKTIYIDVKKKVRAKKLSFSNIPDGYLLDLSGNPKLWIIENELSTHDTLKHVGTQLLKFATQFSEGSNEIKEILYRQIKESPELTKKMKSLIKNSSIDTISDALDYAIYRNEFGFIVVIDEATQDLYDVTRELARQPEILEIKKFVSGKESVYLSSQLLEEISETKSTKVRDIKDLDTIVCPARADGFKMAFLGQKAWWAVRVSASMIPQLKYIAMYEVAPISAIRWAGKIESIKPYEDSGKYKIYLSEIFEIEPIKMKSTKYVPQGSRYTNYHLLQHSRTLEDIF